MHRKKYDIKQMLEEIKADEALNQENETILLSQDEIKKMINEKTQAKQKKS